jgi:hypothetical protein
MLTFAQFPIPDILYIVWKITRNTFIFDYVFSSVFRTLHTTYVDLKSSIFLGIMPYSRAY